MRSAHQHRLLDVVGDHQHRLHRQLAVGPQVDQVGAQRLGGQHVQRAERLVHQQQVGVHHQRARQPDALAHAAGEFLRDRRSQTRPGRSGRSPLRPALPARPAGTPRASSPSSTFSCTVSQGNSAKLWNTMATPSAGPLTGVPRHSTSPEVGRSRPETIRSSVDLPEPDRPSSATISPSRSVRLTLSSTTRSALASLW